MLYIVNIVKGGLKFVYIHLSKLIKGRFSYDVITAPVCTTKVDLCLIIDSSGSIRDNNPSDGSFDNWGLQLQFLADFVEAFDIGADATQIGAVVFSEQVNLVFSLDQYTDASSIKQAILNLAYLGQTTNTPEGLRVTRTQCFQGSGDRSDVPNLAVIITDGVPFPPNRRDPAIQEANNLKGLPDTSMISIGITDVIDKDLLREMSSSPQIEGQNFFTATSFEALQDIKETVVTGTCAVIEPSKLPVEQLSLFNCKDLLFRGQSSSYRGKAVLIMAMVTRIVSRRKSW